MRTTLVDRADFVYVADLEPVPAPAGLYSLRISTVWRQAKVPTDERVGLELLLDRKGLEALRELVEGQLQGG
jgi:hypothetical protein